MARIVTQWLQTKLKTAFVIDNKAGAGGAIGATQAAQAAPDGYTLMFAGAPQIAVVPKIQKVNYDPIKDFVPVSIFGTAPFVLAVNSGLAVKTVPELVAHAKANPGKLNYGSGGIGTVGHLAGALFTSRAQIDVVHVPFRGAGPVITALVSGQIQIYFGPASELIPQAESGAIRFIGVASDKRISQLPDVPTIGEYYPDFRLSSWNGFLVPAGAPMEIVARLASLTAEAARDQAVIESLHKLGIEPNGTTPSEFVETIRQEQPAFDAAIAAAGLKQQ
jgi:tripartite-type tricarboxylate transporter receptor subunit TctC